MKPRYVKFYVKTKTCFKSNQLVSFKVEGFWFSVLGVGKGFGRVVHNFST